MANTCPFCEASISEDLSLYGGTCPTCFGEVPGEDTPTDPGAEVAAEIAAADEARQRKKTMVPILFGVGLVSMLTAGAAFLAIPKNGPEFEPLVFDADFGLSMEELAAYEEPDPERTASETESNDAGSSGGTKSSGGGSRTPAILRAAGAAPDLNADSSGGTTINDDGEVVTRRVRRTGGSAALTERETVGDIELTSSGSVDPFAVEMGSAAQRRRQATLESADEIQQAVSQMIRAGGRQVKQCYEQQLKSNEFLSGTWRLSFLIGQDGSVTNAKVAPDGTQDKDLESCIATKMGSWRLGYDLERSQPVEFPVALAPG